MGSHGSLLVTTIHDKGDAGLRSLVARLEGNDCFVVFGVSLKIDVDFFSGRQQIIFFISSFRALLL